MSIRNFFKQTLIESIIICVRLVTSVCLDICISYLEHGFITMKRCVAYTQDPIRPWPQGQFKGIVLWFHVRDTALLGFFDIVIPYLGHESLTMGRCMTTIYDLLMTLALYQGDIFNMNLYLGKIVFALWYRHTKLGT